MKSGLLFQNVVKICSQFQYQLSYTHTESLLTHIHIATYKHLLMYIMHPYIDTHAYMNAMPGVVIKPGMEQIRVHATLQLDFFSF